MTGLPVPTFLSAKTAFAPDSVSRSLPSAVIPPPVTLAAVVASYTFELAIAPPTKRFALLISAVVIALLLARV